MNKKLSKAFTMRMNVNTNFMVENVTKIEKGTTVNVDMSAKIRDNISFWKKYIWNLSTCICEKRKYLESIICDSVIICDKIIYTK